MKTGAWLRGGRGKIAGMVAQKSSDGKGTVLRELVTPSNPQTIDQMATRLAFGTVTQAAALMLPIIGQTFKGQSDEKLNRRRFVSLNVPVLKAEAKAQNDNPSAAIGGLFRGKSSSSLIPNSYIISEGSLRLDPRNVISVDVNGANRFLTSAYLLDFPYMLEAGHSYKPSEIIASILGIEEQQQLTLVAIVNRETILYNEPTSGDFIRDCGLAAFRIVLNTDAPTFTYTAQMTEQEVIAAVLTGLNRDKTSVDIIDLISQSCGFSEGRVTFTLTLSDVFVNTLSFTPIAMGFVVSQLVNGIWDYSTTQMVLLPPVAPISDDNDAWYGLTFSDALVDYLGADAASKLYTRKGGLINDI